MKNWLHFSTATDADSSSSGQSSSSESGSSSSTDTEPKVLCNSNPCKNGGICNGVDGSCHCINGYSGPLCETTNSGPRVTCHQTPCKNGGTCLDTPDGTCSCINGYTGPLCETPNSGTRVTCHPNPCKNGGICNGVDGSCHYPSHRKFLWNTTLLWKIGNYRYCRGKIPILVSHFYM